MRARARHVPRSGGRALALRAVERTEPAARRQEDGLAAPRSASAGSRSG